jgi:hypothetical protein
VKQRLVNVSKPNAKFRQRVEDFRFDPAAVTHFKDEWAFAKPIPEPPEVIAVFRSFLNDQGN